MSKAISVVSIALLGIALGGCASLPDVDLPSLTSTYGSDQRHDFVAVTPDKILLAAETVLRKHKPEGQFYREGNRIVMESKYRFFYGVMAGYDEERWVISAIQQENNTVALVAMGRATDGYVLGLETSGKTYPRKGVRIDYSMFWKRLESVLKNGPWPECEKGRVLKGETSTYEPLCM